MFTAGDLIERKEASPGLEVPYRPLAGQEVLPAIPPIERDAKCCSCSEACECIAVNTKTGAVLGGWLVTVAGGMIGACCLGPPLVLLDFCCFPPKENHDCGGRLCQVCGIAAAIPGVPAGAAGTLAGGSVGLVTGVLCSPVAFFGKKPQCYNGASAELDGIVKGVYDEIMGNEPPAAAHFP
jgi:hypothetical protein